MIEARTAIQVQVDNKVNELSTVQAAYFGLACCERVEVQYAAFAAAHDGIDDAFMRHTLDRLWNAFVAGDFTIEDSDRLLAQIDALAPHPDRNRSVLVLPALYALDGIGHLLRFLQDGDGERIQGICELPISIITYFVNIFAFPTDGRYIPPWLSNQAHSWLNGAPAIYVELNCQLRILETIASIHDWSDEEVGKLRTLAAVALYNPLGGEFGSTKG